MLRKAAILNSISLEKKPGPQSLAIDNGLILNGIPLAGLRGPDLRFPPTTTKPGVPRQHTTSNIPLPTYQATYHFRKYLTSNSLESLLMKRQY